MRQHRWQKSSFSTGGEGECVELASGPTGHIHVRESDRPDEIATVASGALYGLLRALKADGSPGLRA
ncbi:DUF397 domain-containing protein [Streptomyces sp. NPDC003006]